MADQVAGELPGSGAAVAGEVAGGAAGQLADEVADEVAGNVPRSGAGMAGTGRGRRVVVPLLALVLAATTAACGGDSEEETYCASFLERRQELSDLAGRQAEAAKQGEGVDVLSPTLAAFEELRGKAPEDLRDEWDTLVFAYRDLAAAVESSGLEPAQFQVGETPEGLAPAERRALARVASKLGSARVVEAATGIEGYSAQVCEEAGDDSGEGEGDGSAESAG